MHWTLTALLALGAATLAANALVWRLTEQVRAVGLALALGWAVQQGWWWHSGGDSLLLFVLSDAVIVAVLWRERASWHWTDPVILLLLVALWANHAATALAGETAALWWAEWFAVTAQLVLALPWAAPQRIFHTVSHGPLRAGSIPR